MRGSVFSLRNVQIGKESQPGTAIPATELLLCEGSVDLDYPLFRNAHPIGVLVEHAGPTKLLKKDVNLTLDFDGITFEQMGWIAGMIDVASTTGTTTPYTHDYAPGVAALWAPGAHTIECEWTDGAIAEDVEFEYAMARALTFSIEQEGQLKVSADIFARQATDAAVTSLSLSTTLNPITASMGKVYISDSYSDADSSPPAADAWDGGVIISAELVIDTGMRPFHGVSGDEYFTQHKEVAKSFELTLTTLYDTAAADSALAERAKAQSESLRFVTLNFVDSAARNFRITVAGKHEQGDFLGMSNQDGLDVVDMRIIGHYDPTGAHLVTMELVNSRPAPLTP